MAKKEVKKAVAKKSEPKKAAPKKVTATTATNTAKATAVKKTEVKKAVVQKTEVKKTIAKKEVTKAVVKKSEPKKAAPKKVTTATATKTAKSTAVKKTEVKKAVVKKSEPKKSFPKVRYSDEDLKFFKELILEKLAKAKDDYDMLRRALSNSDSFGVEDTSPSFSSIEEGTNSLIREENGMSAHRLYKYIENLEKALIRIENKTYGISRLSGKLIPKERLKLVPHATLTADEKNSR